MWLFLSRLISARLLECVGPALGKPISVSCLESGSAKKSHCCLHVLGEVERSAERGEGAEHGTACIGSVV